MTIHGNVDWGDEMRASKLKREQPKQVICPKCQGDGKVWADGRTHYPFAHFPTKDCPECNGTGNVPAQLKETKEKVNGK